MNNLLLSICKGWHPARLIYLLIGAVLIVEWMLSMDLPFALLGGLFLYQSIFNTGCCGMSGAFRSVKKESTNISLKDTHYQE